MDLYLPNAVFSERDARKHSPALIQSLSVLSQWIFPRSMWVQSIFSRHDWAVRPFSLPGVFIILGVVRVDEPHYSVDSSLSTNPNLTHVRSIYSAPKHAFFLRLDLPKCLFISSFPTNILYLCLLSPTHDKSAVHCVLHLVPIITGHKLLIFYRVEPTVKIFTHATQQQIKILKFRGRNIAPLRAVRPTVRLFQHVTNADSNGGTPVP
jgi:hypothetical protein